MGKKGVAVLVIGLALACAACMIGFILLVKAASQRRDARMAAEQTARDAEVQAAIAAEREERRNDAVAAFADPKRPTAEEEDEFTPVFDSLGRALAEGDESAVTRAFDPDRMMKELERIGTFDRLPPNMINGLKEGMRQGMNQKLGASLVANEMARWSHTDIRRVRWSADRKEVVVIAIHRNDAKDDIPTRIRWWLIRRGNTWKIYDYEDMHLGLSATRLIAAIATPEAIERLARDPLAFQQAAVSIREALVLIGKGDIEGGDAALAPARKLQLPQQFQAILEVAEGSILLGRGDAAGALTRLDTAERLLPGMPICTLLRGSAYVHLGRQDDGLAAVRAYQKEIGPDGLSCQIEGVALESQGKLAEAAEAYRRALDETPEYADAFNGLRRVLPNDQKKELGDRLARVKDPRKTHDELAAAARQDGDEAAVAALLDGLRRARPDDAVALAEDIRQQVKVGKFAAAAKLLERALKGKDREDRDSALSAYLYAMLAAHKAPEAYAAVPDAYANRAFRTLADDLESDLSDSEEDAELARKQLTALIAAHRARDRSDAWTWFFESAILQHDKKYEQAEKGYASGAAMLPRVPPPAGDPDEHLWDADRFRERRVMCLFKLKKGLEAYRKLPPAADTFRQLAGLYDGEDDLDGLEALIKAHREAGVRDPERGFWQAHLLYRKKEYEKAAPAYQKYLDESDEKTPGRWRARGELLRCVLRTKPGDAGKTLTALGSNNVDYGLRAAVAAAIGNRAELERLFAESTKNGGKPWFYSDEDFRRFIYQEMYRDLRTKYPDPNPPPKLDG